MTFRNLPLLASGMTVAATLVATPLAADPDLLGWAGCIGGADAYAEAASEFGYPAAETKARNDLRIARLADLEGAPSIDELERARGEGMARWQSLAAQPPHPPLPEDLIPVDIRLFHFTCDQLRKEMLKRGHFFP